MATRSSRYCRCELRCELRRENAGRKERNNNWHTGSKGGAWDRYAFVCDRPHRPLALRRPKQPLNWLDDMALRILAVGLIFRLIVADRLVVEAVSFFSVDRVITDQ